MSVLSFRYLDWDPVIHEILRVLKPGGELLIVDMVAAPVRWRELPRFLADKARAYLQRVTRPGYFRALRRMVSDRRWQIMLQYNPMRAEHETCTHYPAIRGQIQALLPDCDLVDPAEATAEHLRREWPQSGKIQAPDLFFTTGDPDAMRRAAWSAFGNRLSEVSPWIP